jgi:hypothetical protein
MGMATSWKRFLPFTAEKEAVVAGENDDRSTFQTSATAEAEADAAEIFFVADKEHRFRLLHRWIS